VATRSIVAEVSAAGWRGRYCHWDGHPATKVDQLLLLVARDGVETVTRTLIHDNYSWSSIDPFTKQKDDEQWKFVEGYGYAHNDLEENQQAMFTEADTEFAWAEYLYVLGAKGLQVWTAETDTDGVETWVTSEDAFYEYLTGKALDVFATMEKMRKAQ
jgi:hypothetical protein